jgi:DNA-binding beta-propeller fold protein YncE
VVLLGLALLVQLWNVMSGELRTGDRLANAKMSRLVAIHPLPELPAAMCQWEPASFTSTIPQEDQSAADGERVVDFSRRRPVRMIRDPYAAYSAVAVDPVHDEVVLTDENLFSVVVYDRTENTPPNARLSEPKRMIGGLSTKIEFQCGIYIDPANGDIYAVNNDTVNTLVIFSRNAKGDVPPDRELYTPHSTFGIAVDEAAHEMFFTIQVDSAVVVYRKYAEKDEAPIRLIQGDRTLLADPHGIAIDTKNQLMFVSNWGSTHSVAPERQSPARGIGGEVPIKSNWPLPRAHARAGSGRNLPPAITVYPLKATGNVSPLRVIEGPRTRLNWPGHLFMDQERGELYVANDMDDSVLVFDSLAAGNVDPKRILKGPRTLLKNPTGIFVDFKNDELWVANFGNHAATVYRRNASGDTAPVRIIRSGPLEEPALGIGNPHPIAYDSKRDELLVPN